MTKKKISIIIPCYNDHLYLEEAVQSASAQTWENKEIILVDDGSNVETKKVIESLENMMDLLITQENLGVSAARNNGIKAATGDYILVLDSDDFFEPEFCEMAINAFLAWESLVLVTCYANWFGVKGDVQIFKPRGGKLKNVLFSNIAMGSSMFKKKDWEKVGGYDENMIKGFEDWEFYIRLHTNGGETYVIPEVLFNYRKKEISRNKIANKHKFELLEYIYLKHADLYKDNFEYFVKHLMQTLHKAEKTNKSQTSENAIVKLLAWPQNIKAIIKGAFKSQ